ncbi:MAG: c-type cytochrome [Acidiferrobacterales bacterium]|nr:c-type cytochrome [Acidiferrobacterales bacterium]
MKKSLLTLVPAALLIAFFVSSVGCSKKDEEKTVEGAASSMTEAEQADAGRLFDVERIARGAKLFQEKCAQCHGPEAQGHPDWERGRKEGYAAAPPLNGTGTDITLSKIKMMTIIRNGLKQNGLPVMPAWAGRVSDQDIEDVITWFQALWPADTYQAWQRAYAPDELPDKTGKVKG